MKPYLFYLVFSIHNPKSNFWGVTAYVVAFCVFHSGWWTGLVLVGLVCGGGVHLDGDMSMVFVWGNGVLSPKVYNLYI